MKRKMFISLMLFAFCLLMFTGCATLGLGTSTKTFDQLTPDEQARVVISAIQSGSPLLFDVGKTVMIVKPEYQAAWKAAVIPGFNQINKLLLDLETRGKAGQVITMPVILTALQGRIAEITNIIASYGTIPVSPGAKPTVNDYGLIAILGLSTATIAWNDIVVAMSGQIPTWDSIIARNMAFQAKIDAA